MALKLKDVADRLNISTATVSLVLNNKPGVSEETRQRVLKLIQELGYDTNILSKPALKNNKNIRFVIYKKHGKVVSDTPFFSTLMEGIEQEARKDGYNLVITYVTESENKQEVLRIIEENPLEGMIILATEMLPEDLQPFTRLGIQLVILDRYFKGESLDTVMINNTEGAYEATKHLIDMGHSEIGYLHSTVRIKNFEERKEGYSQALKDYAIKENKKYMFNLGSTLEDAYVDMSNILKSDQERPTAFFADNDIIAFGAIKAIKEYGLKIPEDISIIGFDDMPFCEIIEPALTTVKVYKQRMGMLAVKRLLEKLEGNAPEFIKLEIGTELVVRKSVSCRNEPLTKLSCN